MVELLGAAAALVTRAMLQAADAALVAVGADELREASTRPSQRRAARLLQSLKGRPEHAAAALRAASSGLLAGAAVACAMWVGDRMGPVGDVVSRLPLQLLAALFAGVVALVLDLAPRSLAAARPLEWGLWLAGPAWALSWLLWPLTAPLLSAFDRLLLGRGATARYTPPPPPLEQIEKFLAEEARTDGSAPPPEMVHGLFQFAERIVKEIMVPRTQVVGVPRNATPQEVMDLLAEEGHTRMPVYDGSLDRIVGVLHAKDVIPLVANPQLIVLEDLLRAPLFVPWNMPVSRLLREMQQKRSHLALVVDEYGGFDGVVSIEDILREIVGELPEEHEAPEAAIKLGSDGTAVVPAGTKVTELNESLGAALPEDGAETLAGLLNATAGAIPQQGDCFFVGGLELTVTERDDRRVRSVKVRRMQSQPPPPK